MNAENLNGRGFLGTCAHGAFIQDPVCDRWTRHGRVDLMAKVMEFIKDNGLIARNVLSSLTRSRPACT